jgi:hypothetical protein
MKIARRLNHRSGRGKIVTHIVVITAVALSALAVRVLLALNSQEGSVSDYRLLRFGKVSNALSVPRFARFASSAAALSLIPAPLLPGQDKLQAYMSSQVSSSENTISSSSASVADLDTLQPALAPPSADRNVPSPIVLEVAAPPSIGLGLHKCARC